MNLKINILFILCFIWSVASGINQYTNSVIIPANYRMGSAADPFVLKDANGSYYCYVTGKGFPAFASRDLVRWIKTANPFPDNNYKWATDNFWAPEVVKVGSTYYMHYTGKATDGFMKIGLARSTSPLGPFADVSNKPFYSMKNNSIIDSHIFFDDNGKAYLFFAKDMSTNYVPGSTTRRRSEIWGIEIKPDLSDTIGPAKQLFYPSQSWESPYNNEAWNEAPTMIKHNGMYYLMYSANCYCDNYSVGYAIAKSPLGPWVKYAGNPILKSVPDYVSGPGHNSVVMSPDNSEMICVYHSHIDLVAKGGNRKINIDRMGFAANGVLYINGPTYTAQNYPSATLSGVEDPVTDSSELKIIFDPSKEQISINTPANSSKISVYNTWGTLVYTAPINMDMNHLNINANRFPKGLYIVRLDYRDMSSTTGKFIKR